MNINTLNTKIKELIKANIDNTKTSTTIGLNTITGTGATDKLSEPTEDVLSTVIYIKNKFDELEYTTEFETYSETTETNIPKVNNKRFNS